MQAVFTEIQTRFYIVRAVVKNVNANTIVLTSEDKYYIKVTDPCTLPNQIVPQALPDIDYWIKDAAVSITINPFVDTTTRDFGN